VQNLLMLVGRVLLAAIFVWVGYGKIVTYEGTQDFMTSQGVPSWILPLVILLECGGGIAIILGFFTRLIAFMLAVFCVASAILFHTDGHSQLIAFMNDMVRYDYCAAASFMLERGGDYMQIIMFMKNITMAGGFLVLAASGPGDISLDNRHSRPASD